MQGNCIDSTHCKITVAIVGRDKKFLGLQFSNDNSNLSPFGYTSMIHLNNGRLATGNIIIQTSFNFVFCFFFYISLKMLKTTAVNISCSCKQLKTQEL